MINLILRYLSPSLVSVTPSDYDEACRTQMGAVPGIRWDKGKKHYVGPPEAVNIAVSLLESAGVAKAKTLTAYRDIADDLTHHWSHDASWLRLRDYQQHGVIWCRRMLRESGGTLLADDMGLGKTLQAITTADIVAPGQQRIVVCPAIAVANWWRQIRLWGSDESLWEVYSYAAFRKKHAEAKLAVLVILDEGHMLANPKSQQTQAVIDYLDGCKAGHFADERPMVLALTGTPYTTYIRDMWSLLNILHPGRWGSKWQFERRYAGGHDVEIPNIGKVVWKADGATNQAELATRLQSVMLRRLKADVASELPSRSRQMIEVDIAKTAIRAEKALVKTAKKAKATFAVHEAVDSAEKYKIDAAIELAQQCVANGQRPLLVTRTIDSAKVLGAALMCPQVDGTIDAKHRREMLLSGGGPGVATILSITTAIDLCEFDTIIFVGLDWVPSNLLQCESRIHRIGQSRPVTFYYIIALGTIDEAIRERILERLDTFGAVVGDSDTGLNETLSGGSEDDILQALANVIMGK